MSSKITFSNSEEISSVIRQKGESQNGCFKKVKHAKISEKETFVGISFGVYKFIS